MNITRLQRTLTDAQSVIDRVDYAHFYTEDVIDLMKEHCERGLEITRHHRDFASVSSALDHPNLTDAEKLKRIRNIVG